MSDRVKVGKITYIKVTYNGQSYAVCQFVKHDGEEKLFVVDYEDLPKLFEISTTWYAVSSYVGYNLRNKNNYKTYYVHNVVMDKFEKMFNNRGQELTYDHLNRIPYDNRKANLRLKTQSQQNENQNKKKRTITLPKDCGFTVHDIPKGMWFDTSRNRFVIDITKDGKKFKKTLTGDSGILPKDKLVLAKLELEKLCEERPDIVGNKNLLQNYSIEAIELIKEFNAIIMKSGFKCAKHNIHEVPKQRTVIVDKSKMSDAGIKALNVTTKTKGRGVVSKLPDNCGVTIDMIPQYCYYRPESNTRGDKFIIDRRNPLLPSGSSDVGTTESKSVDTYDKYVQLIGKINSLERINNKPLTAIIKKKVVDKTIQKSVEKPIQKSVEQPIQKSIEKPIKKPVNKVVNNKQKLVKKSSKNSKNKLSDFSVSDEFFADEDIDETIVKSTIKPIHKSTKSNRISVDEKSKDSDDYIEDFPGTINKKSASKAYNTKISEQAIRDKLIERFEIISISSTNKSSLKRSNKSLSK